MSTVWPLVQSLMLIVGIGIGVFVVFRLFLNPNIIFNIMNRNYGEREKGTAILLLVGVGILFLSQLGN
ncbi:MAG: hypothetical protein AAF683_14995 [Pseudomonadota bacterium]